MATLPDSFVRRLEQGLGIEVNAPLDPDEQFLLAAVVGSAAVVNADGTVVAEEMAFVREVLQRALGAPDLGETTVGHVRAAVVEAMPEWAEILCAASHDLGDSARTLLVALLAGAAVSDGNVAEEEQKVLTRAAEVLGIEPGVVETAVSKSLAGGGNPGLTWPDKVEVTALAELSHHLRLALVQTFGITDRKRTGQGRDATDWSSPLKSDAANCEYLQEGCRRASAVLAGLLDDEQIRAAQVAVARAQQTPLRVVALGGFSTGKSTFMNALLGQEVLPCAAIPCSAAIVRVRAGESTRYLAADGDGERPITKEEYYELVRLSETEANAFGADANRPRPELVVELNAGLPPGVELVDMPGLYDDPSRTEVVNRYLDTADAAIVVMNAIRPLGESERATMEDVGGRLSRMGQKAETLFAVFNFCDLLRTPDDRDKVRRRARAYLGNKLPADRIWLVSSLGAVDECATRPPPPGSPGWAEQFDDLASAIGRFLGTGPARGRLERLRRTVLGSIESALEGLDRQIAALEARASRTQTDVTRSREAIDRAQQASTTMLESVDTTGTACGEISESMVMRELELVAFRLRDASQGWTTSKNVFFSPKQVAEEFAERAKSHVASQMKTLQDEALRPMLEDQMERLRKELDVHALEFERALTEADLAIGVAPPDIEVARDEDGALKRVLRGTGGWIAGGPLGALVADRLGWKGVFENAAINVAVLAVLSLLGFVLGPVEIVALVAAVGVAQLLVGAEGVRRKLAERVAEKAAEGVRKAAPDIARRVREGVDEVFSRIRSSLQTDLEALIRLRARDLEVIRDALLQVDHVQETLGSRLERAKTELGVLHRELEAWNPE